MPGTAYRVDLTGRALRDIEAIFDQIAAAGSPAAAIWFNALEELILSLEQLPFRGSPTTEDRRLRQLLHGTRPHVYRIIYSVQRTTRRVQILHIRHGAQDRFRPTTLG